MNSPLRVAYGKFLPLLLLMVWIPSIFSSLFFLVVAPESNFWLPLLSLSLAVSALSILRAKRNEGSAFWVLYWALMLTLHLVGFALAKVYLFLVIMTIIVSWPLVLSLLAGSVISASGLVLEIMNRKAEPDGAGQPDNPPVKL
jgi:hypothetical protein